MFDKNIVSYKDLRKCIVQTESSNLIVLSDYARLYIGLSIEFLRPEAWSPGTKEGHLPNWKENTFIIDPTITIHSI